MNFLVIKQKKSDTLIFQTGVVNKRVDSCTEMMRLPEQALSRIYCVAPLSVSKEREKERSVAVEREREREAAVEKEERG